MRRAHLLLTFAVLTATAVAHKTFETVYVTKSGKKYHTSRCGSLRKSKIPMERSEAVRMGYGACGRCKP